MIYNALYNDKRRACALISGPYADRAAATAELASDRAWVEAHVVGGHFASAFGRWFAVELAATDAAGEPWRTARHVLETGRSGPHVVAWPEGR